jgi:polysaccharide export outer membrane protein
MFILLAVCSSAPMAGQTAQKPSDAGSRLPTGYVIGLDDLLTVRFWGDTQMSADVVVRTDGKISLPLLNDVSAVGMTPEHLADVLEKAASKFVAEPDATVIVREIRSRKVFVLGQVARPGAIPLNVEMNVLQVLAAAGGLLEYADKDDVIIIRNEGGSEQRLKFNYNDVIKGKNIAQNVFVRPGDTVIVK